jgi:membrane protein DedA with SNARE-associated domain
VSLVSDFFVVIANFITATITTLGYGGVFLMMVLESMVFPSPSEIVMPFAGYIASQGTSFNLVLVIVVSTLGSIVGSLLSFYIGKHWGTHLVEKYGKYVLISLDDLHRTESWFEKRGEATIFFARLIPVVRHLISLVAGVAEMDLKRFCVFTILGAAIWNSLMGYLGFYLGQNWQLITRYTDEISLVITILIVLGVIWYVARHLLKRKEARESKHGV